MCKLLLILFVLFSLVSFGQTPMHRLIAKRATASYAFLLDDYTGATAAYSLRKLSSTQSNDSCIKVRRSSDNTEQVIGFSNNVLDTAAMKTFVGTGGSDDGFVVAWYDASGNYNTASQSTAINQPSIMENGVIYRVNDFPAIYINGTLRLGLTTALASNATFSIFGVQSRTSTTHQIQFFSHSTQLQPYSAIQFTDGNVYLTDGTNYVGGADGLTGLRYYSSLRLSGTLTLYRDGSAVTGLSGAAAGASTFDRIGNRVSTSATGYIIEGIYYPSDKSSDRTNIEANINSYY